jgi:hypothetical protein
MRPLLHGIRGERIQADNGEQQRDAGEHSDYRTDQPGLQARVVQQLNQRPNVEEGHVGISGGELSAK